MILILWISFFLIKKEIFGEFKLIEVIHANCLICLVCHLSSMNINAYIHLI